VKSADTEDTEEYLYMEMEHRIGIRMQGKFTGVLNTVALIVLPSVSSVSSVSKFYVSKRLQCGFRHTLGMMA
jgi:hypothetical protein